MKYWKKTDFGTSEAGWFQYIATLLKKGTAKWNNSQQDSRMNGMVWLILPVSSKGLSNHNSPTELLPQNATLQPFFLLFMLSVHRAVANMDSDASENAETGQYFFIASHKTSRKWWRIIRNKDGQFGLQHARQSSKSMCQILPLLMISQAQK